MVFRELVARHAVAAYVALTFLVPWGGLLLVGGPAGSTGTAWQTDARLPLMIIAMLAGPSLAGLLLTGLTGGRDALRGLWHRLTTWHVAVRWYAVALLTAPTVFAIVHLVLSRRSPGLLPSLGAGVAWRGVLAALAVSILPPLHLLGGAADLSGGRLLYLPSIWFCLLLAFAVAMQAVAVPLAGWLRDRTGAYETIFAALGAATLLSEDEA